MSVAGSFGLQPNGDIGLYFAKFGFDVYTADIMGLGFTSDFVCPNLVATGTVIAGPTSGYAPTPTLVAGAHQTVTTVGFGRTISPPPFVAAIASAASWAVPTVNAAAQLAYLAGKWHTFIREYPPDMTGRTAQTDNTYGATAVHFSSTADGRTDLGDSTFSSARFTMNVTTTGVQFTTNCRGNVSIKYVILEP